MDVKKKKLLEQSYERIVNLGMCLIPYEDLSDIIADDLLGFGTTKDELMRSFKDVDDLFRSQIEQMGDIKPIVTRERLETRFLADGNTAIIVELLSMTLISGDINETLNIRATAMFEFDEGRYRLVHSHASKPVDTENDHWHMEEWKREKEKLQQLVDEQTAALKQNNRDLQIEAALERIRSRSLAMHSSDEFVDASDVMVNQLKELGIDTLRIGIGIINKVDDSTEIWSKSEIEGKVKNTILGVVPRGMHPIFDQTVDAWKKNESFYSSTRIGVEVKEYYQKLDAFLSYPERKEFNEQETMTAFFFPHGSLNVISLVRLKEEDCAIMIRIAKVFGQIYQRFLDLQKAEAQAREAEIQLALERVRARTMAMHHSSELGETSYLLFEQLKALGKTSDQTSIAIYSKDGQYMDVYITLASSQWKKPVRVKVDDSEVLEEVQHAWKKKEKSIVIELSGKKLKEFNKLRSSVSTAPVMSNEKRWILHAAFFSQGALIFSTANPQADETIQLLERFAQVFNQTYTRFLDLENAEAQAREADIQLALERVRAKSLAMHNSNEVGESAEMMYEELKRLGLDSARFGIAILYKDKMLDVWNIRKVAKSKPLLVIGQLHVDIHPFLKLIFEAWRNNQSSFVREVKKSELKSYYKAINNYPGYPIRVEMENIPERQFGSSFFFDDGFLYAFTDDPIAPEKAAIMQRFANSFGQIYRRYQDLIKVERQAREAQIEAALERVRAASMAMHKSDELAQVVFTIDREVAALGIALDNSSIITDFDLNDLEKGINNWIAVKRMNYYLQKFHIPYDNNSHVGKRLLSELKKGAGHYIDIYSKSEKNQYLRWLFKYSDFKTISNERQQRVYDAPGWTRLVIISKNSLLIFQRYELTNFTQEEVEIFKRFGVVFEQTYTRFLDLQKAEAQARESQIEAALERVRSRSMAMHHSQELEEVVGVTFNQLQSLNLPVDGCQLITFEDQFKDLHFWSATPDMTYPVQINIPYFDNPVFTRFWEAKDGGHSFTSFNLTRKETLDFYNHVYHTTDLGKTVSKERWKKIQSIKHGFQTSWGIQKNTGLFIFNFDNHIFTPEENSVIDRFSKVFDQTYTRFLDLKKAEAQARDAQIEAALERIRSRAMAMQHSEELRDVALELRTQMGILGQKELEVCAIHLYEEQKKHFESWAAMHLPGKEKRLLQFKALFPKSGYLIIDEMMECYASDQNEYVLVNEGEKGKQWFELLREKAPEAFQYLIEATANIPEEEMKAYWAIADFSGGALVMVTYFYPDKDSQDLLRRTANVFALAYKRFKDLRLAESSARAALQQASLDRVRADISSMRHAEDLNLVTPLVFNELTTLGIPFIRCGVFIVHEKEKNVEIYLSNPEGKSLAVMTLPFEANEMTSQSVKAWKNEEVFIQHWDQADFTNWSKSIQEQGYVKDLKTYQGTAVAPETLHLHFVPFGQGLLYVGSPENLSEEQIDLVKAMANAFSIAYARYEDFVKLEQAKAEVESAMSELKATQSQLVQQEKLASLGQLTAGIAHEIKNPLNFVNNFSEVSIELIEEALEEIVKTQHAASPIDQNESLDDIIAILDDVQSNLHKIHEHGSRANNIVSSMLQHSRGGSGKKEPTDLNALIKEYVNLSYHGMRAGKNPINVDIHLNLDDSIGDVSLIAEDFSRVILNLCNNAFDAMRTVETQHAASLRVCTKKSGDAITIEIEDNGPGIPDDIKDKILQPFFTTKKGTEGTGLGLSITHDIIKAHGGQINIESNENEGSKFSILLDV